jgi:putative FmdB family regulatory protein
MPLYEYECDACRHRFEVIQKFSDRLADSCPKCKGTVHKLFSSPAIQFKGSGFYITDYAKADHVSAEKADSATSDTAAKSTTAAASDTSAKADTSTKADKTSGDTSSSTSSSTPAPSTSPSSTKKRNASKE